MPTRRADLVSVVVLHRHDAASTVATIESVRASDWPAHLIEVLVMTDGAASTPAAAALGPHGRVVSFDPQTQHPLNVAARRAKGEYLAVLEAGSRPRPSWVRASVRSFHSGLEIGAVACTVMSHDGSVAAFTGGGMTWFGMGYNTTGTAAESRRRDVLFGTRSASLYRRSALLDVGGFDRHLAEAYDDVDLGWRLNLFGYRVAFAPDAIVDGPAVPPVATPRHILERNSLIALYKNLEDDNVGKFLTGALGLATQRAVSSAGLDEGGAPDSSLDAREPTVSADALAALVGANEFVQVIGELAPARDAIQLRRVVRDEAIFSLFGDARQIVIGDARADIIAQTLAASLGIETDTSRIRVLVVTGDLLGPKMAGPAIRAWNMSEQLSLRNEVRLVSSVRPARVSTAFDVHHAPDDRAMAEHESWADVIVMQGYILRQFPSLARSSKILVADIYDPLHLEQLEQARTDRFEDWNSHVVTAAEVLNEQIARADFLLCASEKQRDFWLGQLAAVGRVNAMTYEADNALRDLIDVAPFGLDPLVPPQARHAIKGAIPGIDPDDKVIVWGGGIYDWFDTETLLRAMAKVSETHSNARLFFLGAAHPNPGVPMMKAQARTFELAEELGLTDRVVFFNHEWVAFDDRHNYLLDADAGVSTHFEHIETAFSFRTRILDYLWAGLPMVTTRGDGFAEQIENSPLGVTVPERDVDALAAAIIKVLYDEDFRRSASAEITRARDDYAWSRALEPLLAFCAAPRSAPDRDRSLHWHALRVPDPAAEAIRGRYHGLGKYARLGSLYLRREGIDGFVKRARFRIGV